VERNRPCNGVHNNLRCVEIKERHQSHEYLQPFTFSDLLKGTTQFPIRIFGNFIPGVSLNINDEWEKILKMNCDNLEKNFSSVLNSTKQLFVEHPFLLCSVCLTKKTERCCEKHHHYCVECFEKLKEKLKGKLEKCLYCSSSLNQYESYSQLYYGCWNNKLEDHPKYPLMKFTNRLFSDPRPIMIKHEQLIISSITPPTNKFKHLFRVKTLTKDEKLVAYCCYLLNHLSLEPLEESEIYVLVAYWISSMGNSNQIIESIISAHKENKIFIHSNSKLKYPLSYIIKEKYDHLIEANLLNEKIPEVIELLKKCKNQLTPYLILNKEKAHEYTNNILMEKRKNSEIVVDK